MNEPTTFGVAPDAVRDALQIVSEICRDHQIRALESLPKKL
jgi:hypothetical protein